MLFRIGKIVVSPDVLADSTITVDDLVLAFERYLKGDWGVVSSQSGLNNDLALTSGDPIVATYRAATGTEFCMSTENGRTKVFSAASQTGFGLLNNQSAWRLQAD